MFFFFYFRLRRRTSKCTRRSKKRRKQDGAHIELVFRQVTNQNAKVWWYSNRIENVFVSGLHICLEFSQSPSCSYQAMQSWCKHWKKVFYCFYKVTFQEITPNSLLWHWLKEKFLPVTKSCGRSLARVISSCFAKRCYFFDANQNMHFSSLNCLLKRKKIDTPSM